MVSIARQITIYGTRDDTCKYFNGSPVSCSRCLTTEGNLVQPSSYLQYVRSTRLGVVICSVSPFADDTAVPIRNSR